MNPSLGSVPSGPLTRRRFLKLVGAVGGTPMVMQALNAWDLSMSSTRDAPPPLTGDREGRRVIILGAGLAGMAAAYELEKLGYDTPILEARPRAGGRCITIRGGSEVRELGGGIQRCEFDQGHYLNPGPWRIPDEHTSTLHYCRELDVPLEVLVNRNPWGWIRFDDVEGPLSGRRLRQAEVLADMRGHVTDLLARSVHQDALDLELTPADREKLVAFLVHEGHLNPQDATYGGATRRGWATPPGAAGPGEPSDPHDFLDLLRSGLGAGFPPRWGPTGTVFQPVGGMDQLARALERAVSHNIRPHQEVKEIRQGEEGVRVVVQDTRSGDREEVTGDYCICTIPLTILINIPSDLSGDFQRAMRSVAYNPSGKIGLQFRRRFWEEDDGIYGGYSVTNRPWSGDGHISYPSYGWNREKGVIQAYYGHGGDALRVSAMSPRERIEHALAIGEAVHPGIYREEFETGISFFFHLEPYSLGGYSSWSDEARRNHFSRLLEPDGRVYLSGEHISHLTSWMAGSFESTWMQIEKIHERSGQEGGA